MDLMEGDSTVTVPGTLWCFLCGKRVGSSARSCTNMFQVAAAGNQSLSKCLGAILGKVLQETDVPTPVKSKTTICNKTKT